MKLSLPLMQKKKSKEGAEELLAQALTDIQMGRATLKEILARYPEHRGKLEELLGLTVELCRLPEVTPSYLLRARVMAQVRKEGAASGMKLRVVPWPFQVSWVGQKMAAMAASLFIALALAGAGTVYASWESLPGDPLYSVKTATQEARLALAFGEEDRVQVYLWMAESRLSELDRATQKGRSDVAQELAQGYQYSLALAIGEAQKAQADKSGILSMVEEHLAKHMEVLKEVYDRVPQEAQGAIALALEASQKGSPSSAEGGAAGQEMRQAPSSGPAGEGQAAPSSPSGVGSLPREKGEGTDPSTPPPVKGLPTPTPTSQPGRESPMREGTTPPAPGPMEGRVEGPQMPSAPPPAAPPSGEKERPAAEPSQPQMEMERPVPSPEPPRPQAGQEAEQKRAKVESAPRG